MNVTSDFPNLGTLNLGDIPGWSALIVALFVLYLQLRDRWGQLLLDVTYVHVVQLQGDTALVLFRLSFLNDSSQGKVVYNLLPK